MTTWNSVRIAWALLGNEFLFLVARLYEEPFVGD